MKAPRVKHGPYVPPSGQVKESFLTSLLVKNSEISILLSLNTNCRPDVGVGTRSRKYSS